MAFNEPHQYIIAYDIANPKRLGRLYRFLKKRAIPVQYSVFTALLRHAQLQDLLADIEDIIHPAQDDVRIYPLPKNPKVITIGQNLLADDIYLLENSKDLTLNSSKNK